MTSKRLSSKEKEEVRAELDKINKKLYKDLQGHDLKRIKKETPEMLAFIYAQLYEDGNISYEEAMRNADSRTDLALRIRLSVGKHAEDALPLGLTDWKKPADRA